MTIRAYQATSLGPRQAFVFDAESDGLAEVHRPKGKGAELLPEVTRFWCFALKCVATGEAFAFGPDELQGAIELLEGADYVIGHNIIDFDLRVLQRLHGVKLKAYAIDTLLICRLLWPDPILHPHTRGGNGIDSWGTYFGQPKPVHDDWSQYSPEMLHRCEQDAAINARLWYWMLTQQDFCEQIENIERRLEAAHYLAEQVENGVRIDEDKTRDLIQKVTQANDGVLRRLQNMIPARVQVGKKPQHWIGGGRQWKTVGEAKKHGVKREQLTAGPPKRTVKEFDPASTDWLGQHLVEVRGWSPTASQRSEKTGKPLTNKDVLPLLDYPEAELMMTWRTNNHRQQIANDWLDRLPLTRDGRLHPSISVGATVAGRHSHNQPNVNVPKVKKPWGLECRQCFLSDEGWVIVGWDASGLESCMLTHFALEFGGEELLRIVTEEDLPSYVMDACELDDRDLAKIFLYGGVLYGATDATAGRMIGGTERTGKRKKDLLFQRFPSIRHVIDAAKTEARTTGHLRTISGRLIPNDQPYKATNNRLQGSGADVMELAQILYVREVRRRGIEYRQILNVHDEIEALVRSEVAQEVCSIAEWAMAEAGNQLGCLCPLAAEAKVGQNWAEVH